MSIGIQHIEYYLPAKVLTNEDFSSLGVDPVFMIEKVGISERHIADEHESVCDMADAACRKLFVERRIDPTTIPLLILCTQNPDYVLPTTACVLQERIGMSTSSMCFDINLGCSGYVYAVGLATSLMNQFGYSCALIVTTEAYSKVISYEDKTTATLFSDGAAATYLAKDYGHCRVGDFDFGTDGRGHKNLIVPVSGSRTKRTFATSKMVEYGRGICRSEENLFMDGQEITKFVFREVPKSVNALLARNHVDLNFFDKFIFHQANKYILEAVAKRMNIPTEKMYIDLKIGNTVSSTLPIALKRHYGEDHVVGDRNVLLSGFGVGYSWGSMTIQIDDNFGAQL